MEQICLGQGPCPQEALKLVKKQIQIMKYAKAEWNKYCNENAKNMEAINSFSNCVYL